MPAGVEPVPARKEDGKWVSVKNGEWEFFYRGWKLGMLLPVIKTKYARCGAKQKNMFPNEQIGSLNGKLLKRMGLTQKQMQDGDALFFYQLFLPICNPDKSGIRDDPYKTFYNVVSKYKNKYNCW